MNQYNLASCSYLFFFHRRPEHGPMRVQLTNPVSRFKHIQSLQHMCRCENMITKLLVPNEINPAFYLITPFIHFTRFVIRQTVVRKDLIQSLPLPRRLLDYLSYKNCYSELVESDSSQSPTSEVRYHPNLLSFPIYSLFHRQTV